MGAENSPIASGLRGSRDGLLQYFGAACVLMSSRQLERV